MEEDEINVPDSTADGHSTGINVFEPLICRTITPRELIASPKLRDILGVENLREIKTKKIEDKVKVLAILNLMVQCDNPEIWTVLSEVLFDCDLSFVPKIILKSYDRDTSFQLQQLAHGVQEEDLVKNELFNSLKENKLLNDEDVQDIQTENFNRDSVAAAVVLLDRLDKSPSWFQRFLESLKHAGYDEAVINIMSENKNENGCCQMEDDMDDIATSISPAEFWRKLIMEMFHNLIIETITPSDVLAHLGSVIGSHERLKIRNIQKTSPRDAMIDLLDILDKKDEPRKWNILTEAFVLADYAWIKELLDGNLIKIEDSETWERIVALCEKTFAEAINPRELLPHLRGKGIINTKDSEEVEQIAINLGQQEAAFRLLYFLPKRKPNSWYPDFIEILMENGSEEAVQEIDPDMHMEILKRKSKASPSCETTYSEHEETTVLKNTFDDDDVKQNYKSVSGDGYKSSNNLSCPQKFDELEELYNHTKSEINSYDDDMEEDEVTHEKRVATEASQVQLNNVNMGKVEPDSLMLENLQEELAEEINYKTSKESKHNIVQSPYDDVKSDESDSDSDDENVEKKELILREYQLELAQPALDGKNCIIVAPTGSGKTFVALKIIQNHIETMSKKGLIAKVVFLVEQSALAIQQAKQCKEHLFRYRIKLITGEIKRDDKIVEPLSTWLKRKDILVVTSQLLLNDLQKQDVKIDDFTMLMFDECHHSQANHSYAQIMNFYMDHKIDPAFDKNKLPKVVGLTASVGVGRSDSIQGVKLHIKTTMANLDAEELVTVKENKLELSKYHVIPDQDIITVPGRDKDYFGKAIFSLMETIEKCMAREPHVSKLYNKDKALKAPTEKGSEAYTQWISQFRRDVARTDDEKAKRHFTTCRNYLNMYNQALIIYEDARVKDAMNFLQDGLRGINDGIQQDETDQLMLKLFEKSKKLLLGCVDNPAHLNPKLETLKDVIFKMCKENKDSRIIVFIKTRDLAEALVNWMKETEGLDRLNPVKFVGTQAPGGKGGMTKSDQKEILQLFRDGEHQIINATSVAEEGLDIQTCNLVIRYDHVTNEIAMVQSRGRGRMEGCKFIVIASEKRGTADKENKNIMKEETMIAVIEKLQEDLKYHKEDFMKELEEMQKVSKKKRDQEALSKKSKRNEYELEMKCSKCSKFICMSSDIRKIQNAHHAIINDEVKDNISVVKCRGKYIDSTITVNAGRMKCLKCGIGLGQIIIHQGAQFPIPKIEEFGFTDEKGKHAFYKKWKKVPIQPEGLSEEDLEKRLRGANYIDI